MCAEDSLSTPRVHQNIILIIHLLLSLSTLCKIVHFYIVLVKVRIWECAQIVHIHILPRKCIKRGGGGGDEEKEEELMVGW